MNLDRTGRVKINTVGFPGNFNVFVLFGFADEVLRLIEVIHPFQTTDGNGVDVPDGEISVESIFEGEVMGGRKVGDRELSGEGLANGDRVVGGEFFKGGG